jgi:hypothetical protein
VGYGWVGGGVFAFWCLRPVVLILRFSLYLLPVDRLNGTISTKLSFYVWCWYGAAWSSETKYDYVGVPSTADEVVFIVNI